MREKGFERKTTKFFLLTFLLLKPMVLTTPTCPNHSILNAGVERIHIKILLIKI